MDVVFGEKTVQALTDRAETVRRVVVPVETLAVDETVRRVADLNSAAHWEKYEHLVAYSPVVVEEMAVVVELVDKVLPGVVQAGQMYRADEQAQERWDVLRLVQPVGIRREQDVL